MPARLVVVMGSTRNPSLVSPSPGRLTRHSLLQLCWRTHHSPLVFPVLFLSLPSAHRYSMR